jgi:chromosome transmission fidelity protein 1
MSDVISQLFSHIVPPMLSTFSCGHIIPPDNLKTFVLSKGPYGGELTFKYGQRNNSVLVC